jgi:outer membrane immunogenic protein
MRIVSFLGMVAFASAMAASVQAADLSKPLTKAPPAAYVPATINWTGFYVGAHLGGAWSDANWTNPVSGSSNNVTAGGVLGGVQAGVNYQADHVVWGVEGDFSGASLTPSNTDLAGFEHTTRTYWTSTLTGRLGYAVNQTLFFAKAGGAFAEELNGVVSPFGSVTNGISDVAGWTAGGGVEYALDQHWSAKVEYDYLGFGSQSVPAVAPGGAPGSVDLNIQRVIAGVNYRF